MQLTFTVPLNEEAVGDEVDDCDGEGFSTLSDNGMVEMSVLTPHLEPSGWRKYWHKRTSALLALLLVVALVVGKQRPTILPFISGKQGAQQPPAFDGVDPSAACVDNIKAWGPGGTPGGGVWMNSKGQGCDTAGAGRRARTQTEAGGGNGRGRGRG